jgi:hypothetical protein
MSQGRGVIEVELKRFYTFGAPTKEVPLLTIAFGRIRNGDVRPDSCKANECKEWLDALPTMYMKINPATNSWFTRTKAWVASFNQFRIMFRKIGVNLHDFSLDPGSTDLLFHVDGWLGGTKAIDMKSKANNWFEYFAQREGAIEGQILPEFDASARKSLNDMMTTNLDQLLFQTKK